MPEVFADRRAAGRQLAGLLARRSWSRPVVLGLARGGVPVAADEVVCVAEPAAFRAVGQWYRDFAQTTDDEVVSLLAAQNLSVWCVTGGSRYESGATG